MTNRFGYAVGYKIGWIIGIVGGHLILGFFNLVAGMRDLFAPRTDRPTDELVKDMNKAIALFKAATASNSMSDEDRAEYLKRVQEMAAKYDIPLPTKQ